MKVLLLIEVLLTSITAFTQFPTQLDTIENTTVSPFNDVCYLHIHRNNFPKRDHWYFSTGFFITPNVILTAAHNIHSVPGSRVSQIEVIPAKYKDQHPYGVINVKGKDACEKAIQTHPNYRFSSSASQRSQWDFGIIILQEGNFSNGSSRTEAASFILDSSVAVTLADILNVAGYPADSDYGFTGNVMTYQQDSCRKITSKKIFHQLDTYTGNSGSPVWIVRDNKNIVVGVHTFGGAATRLDKDNLDTLFRWLAGTGL